MIIDLEDDCSCLVLHSSQMILFWKSLLQRIQTHLSSNNNDWKIITSGQRSSRGQSLERSWGQAGSGWGDSGRASNLAGSTFPTWNLMFRTVSMMRMIVVVMVTMSRMVIIKHASKSYLSQNVNASSERCLSMNRISKPLQMKKYVTCQPSIYWKIPWRIYWMYEKY